MYINETILKNNQKTVSKTFSNGGLDARLRGKCIDLKSKRTWVRISPEKSNID
jgi:hypothetical protein